MPAFKHQLAASAYHLKPSDLRKLLLTASNFRDRCLIKTLWWLGVRRSELINLDVRDVDVERKRVTIHKGKGGKTRVIPIINDEYLSDLLLLIGSRKTGPIFLSNRNRGMAPRSVNHIVATLGEQAGVANPQSSPQASEPPSLSTLHCTFFEVQTLQCGVDSELSGT
jgi:site-specific recombinase XerD